MERHTICRPRVKTSSTGRSPCFGYVADDADYLSDVKEGDTIVSAKVTKGVENLQQPK